MRENLLFVPPRRTVSTAIGSGFRSSIEKDYNQRSEKFDDDLRTIDELRDRIVDLPEKVSSLAYLFHYFAQLYALSPKFPSHIRVELTWYNTLGYASDAPVKYSTIQFEKINVVFNIGSLYSLLAFSQPRNETEGLKAAYQYFQLAAGSFKFLVENILSESHSPLPIGLDEDTIWALHDLCLAQAQECFWQRAALQGMKNSIIYKLAIQVSDFYLSALNKANKSNAIRSEWIEHVACKKHHFEAAAQYRCALDCLERGKYGEEVARLQACVEAASIGMTNSRYVAEIVLKDLQGLHDKAKSDLASAEKDNDLIYNQAVPRKSSLPALPRGTAVTRPIVPTELSQPLKYLAEQIQEQFLFKELMPYVVYQSSKAYLEKLEEYVHKNIVLPSNALSAKLHGELQTLSLPGSLDAIERPLGIPDQLLSQSEDIRLKGGISQLKSSMRDVHKLALEVEKLLEESIEVLNAENSEDTTLRMRQGTDRWARETSKQAAKELWGAIDSNKGYLETASTSDKMVADKYEMVNGLLQILENGKPAIEKYVPNSTVVRIDSDAQRSIGYLREALSKARGMELSRERRTRELESSLTRLNLYSSIVKYFHKLESEDPYRSFTASDFEQVYVQALEKYVGDLEWVKQDAKQQKELVEYIKDVNEEFCDSRKTDSKIIERQNAIQSLEIAYNKYDEIKNNLDEGRKFYNSMLSNLTRLLTACKSFVYDRRIEGRNLEFEISQSQHASQRTGYEDPGLEQSMQQLNVEEQESFTPIQAPRPQTPNIWNPERDIRFSK